VSGLEGYEAEVPEEKIGPGGPTLLSGATHAVVRVVGGEHQDELRSQLVGIQQDWEANEAFAELGWLVRLPGLLRLGITLVLSVFTLRGWVTRRKNGEMGGNSGAGPTDIGGTMGGEGEETNGE